MAHLLEREQRLPQPPDEAFEFFSDAFNLERITPPLLRFKVTTPPPIEMKEGTLISYRLRIRGVPVKWLTRIEEWKPGERFVDRQLKGPYKLWHHTHTFEPDGNGGTLMRDVVRYEMPFGPLGEIARRLLVERDLDQIFDYRYAEIERILDSGSTTPQAAG
jgi:ligand-binding SRPBCC domain-containing protein